MSNVSIKFSSVTLDCPNQEELADFYVALLGWNKRRIDEEWLAVISRDETICLLFQEITDYVPPVWPNEKGKQQQMTHLDFAAKLEEQESVTEHALRCGATLASVQYYEHSTVFLDPVGHPFCIGFFA